MSITFNQLVNRIKTTSEDTSTEFVGDIPAFIDRAEARLTREIDSYGVVQYATSNMVIGDPFITKPVNTLIIKNLNIIKSDGTRINLLQKTDEYLMIIGHNVQVWECLDIMQTLVLIIYS